MIEIDDATVRRGGHTLVDRVSLRLEPGEFLAVLGPNGAGKSTLLRLAGGELAPDSGAIRIDGQRMSDLAARDLARRRAILPQSSHVGFPAAAAEIVALGRSPHYRHSSPDEDRRAVDAALARVDMLALRNRLYATLSGGEQQRIQLARVLAQLDCDTGQPRYLLLDEPTSSLDLAHQHAILRVARDLTAHGVGVLAVLHDLNLASAYADRVMVMKSGRSLKVGAPRDVVQPDTIADAFGIRAEIAITSAGGHVVAVAPL